MSMLKMPEQCEPSVYYTTDSPEQQEAGRAVLEAAEAWFRSDKVRNSWQRDEEAALFAAVSRFVASSPALRAARTPAGKKPSEVEPGTRFRFARIDGELSNGAGTYRLVEDLAHDCARRFVDGNCVYSFSPGDLICPLDPQEPALNPSKE